MEIADRTKERSTVILVVLTLVIIGFTVLVSTVQTFRHQREAEEQHLYLTSRAVYLAVESSVRRGPVREGENRLSPRAADFFQALEEDGDVLFVGIVDEQEEKLLTSPVHGLVVVDLPDEMVDDMLEAGEWHGSLSLAGRRAYVYGKRLEALRGMHMSLRDELGPPGFLVVGIDMEKHLGAYAGFRTNVFLQGLYILAAALATWGLGWSFLARREQAGKAQVLELFQARLLDNLPDGLITIDREGVVRSANPAALSILGRSSREVLGRPSAELPPELTASAAAPDGGGWRHLPYGQAHLEVLTLPLENDLDNAWMLIIRDRTKLRNLEKSLANAEKLAAVGALAAGVAHEVRNPLSSLRGFAQYFVKKLAGKSPEEEYAKTMVLEADRLNRVITDLLFLGRPKTIAPRAIDLRALAGEMKTLLRFDLERQNVDIALALDAPEVFADEDSLKQSLLNLLLNSLDALKAGAAADGRAPEPGGAPPLVLASGREENGVYVEVRDAGCGMTQKQQQQAFEAFFTDKESGTGLGLALVQRTMLDHGGVARISSEAGAGCSVRLFFPGPGSEPGPGGRRPSPARERA